MKRLKLFIRDHKTLTKVILLFTFPLWIVPFLIYLLLVHLGWLLWLIVVSIDLAFLLNAFFAMISGFIYLTKDGNCITFFYDIGLSLAFIGLCIFLFIGVIYYFKHVRKVTRSNYFWIKDHLSFLNKGEADEEIY